jgi:hypothetical protein
MSLGRNAVGLSKKSQGLNSLGGVQQRGESVQPSVLRSGIAAPIVGDASMRRPQISGALPSTIAVKDVSSSISAVPSFAVAVSAHDPSQRAALAPSAPSDARTQGDRNSSAIRSTEDAAARSVRGGDSAVRGRGEWAPFPPAMTAPGTGLLRPHNPVPGDASSAAVLAPRRPDLRTDPSPARLAVKGEVA